MGLYEEDDESEVEQEYYKNRMTGSYIAYHARKQLAFGTLSPLLFKVASETRHSRPCLQTFGGSCSPCG